MTKAMYIKGSNLFIYLFIQCSCSKTSKSDKYVNKNFTDYKIEYNIINDSINYYVKNLLKDYQHIYKQDWQIDSFVCINSNRNMLVATINNSNGLGKMATSDAINHLFGKKINNQWYFFQGSTLIVPRDMYGKDEYHPLSFHELSQIARKEMFGENCLVKKDGKWIVNDKWVDYYFYNSGVCGHCITKEQFDSAHWVQINRKWKHKIDTAGFKKQSGNYP